jgi:hypothetical protein
MSEASSSSPRAATGGPSSPARRLATAVVFGVCLFLSVALLFVDNGQSRVETYSHDERMLEGSRWVDGWTGNVLCPSVGWC